MLHVYAFEEVSVREIECDLEVGILEDRLPFRAVLSE
jgi:hypothetical protein